MGGGTYHTVLAATMGSNNCCILAKFSEAVTRVWTTARFVYFASGPILAGLFRSPDRADRSAGWECYFAGL
jgi:hypothetical protein